MLKPLLKFLGMWSFLLGIPTLQAQLAGEGTLGSWHLLSVIPRVSEKISIQVSAQSRYYGQLENFNQFVLRSGANYHINPSFVASLGYGFIVTDPTIVDVPGEAYRKEHQIGNS